MKPAKEGGSKKLSIQDRFAEFRRKKLQESRMRKYISKKGKRTDVQKNALRKKFLSQVESYIGVPYAQKYHDKGSTDYDAPLFLDCCALVRRALNDLQSEFGFRLGRWNQNYQFSTLSSGDPGMEPEDPRAKKLNELQPGDLIFYTATYNSERARKQRLRLVHVEVFTGLGPKGEGTIGARWQKGQVQHFDSYQFKSTSYHSIEFHYRSIEPWLNGVCKPSICHTGWWIDGTANMAINKYSMFNADSKNGDIDYCDDCAGDEEDDGSSSHNSAAPERRRTFYVGKSNGWKLVQAAFLQRGWSQIPFDENFNTKFDLKWVERRSQIDWMSHKDGTKKIKQGGRIKTTKAAKVAAAAAAAEAAAAEAAADAKKEEVTTEKVQLVNHIANNNVITVKTGLLQCLRDVKDASVTHCAKFPETYDLSIASDILKFLKVTAEEEESDDYVDSDDEEDDKMMKLASQEEEKEENNMWILKPSSMNRGRGITVVKDVGPLRRKLSGGKHNEDDGDNAMGIDDWKGTSVDMLVQRYLSKPLLVRGKRKFDIRAYCLVSKCDNNNLVAHYHEGYARVSLCDYETTDESLNNNLIHLTNIAVQKNHPEYEKFKNDAVLSMEELEKHVDCPSGWSKDSLEKQMMASMAAVIASASTKFDRRAGCFDLFGFDFMVSENLEISLIEVNTNPALHVSDGQVLQQLLPGVVEGALDIVLAEQGMESSQPCAEDARKNYTLIFDESNHYRYQTNEQRIFSAEMKNEEQMKRLEVVSVMLKK